MMNRGPILVAALLMFAVAASAQPRLHINATIGLSRPSEDTDFRDWSHGPVVGLGLTYDLSPKLIQTPSVTLISRMLFHNLFHRGGLSNTLFRPVIDNERIVTGESMRVLEISTGIEMLPAGNATPVAFSLSLSTGGYLIRTGKIEIDGSTYRERTDMIRGIVSPGIGVQIRLVDHVRLSIEGRTSILDRRNILFNSITTSLRF